MSFSRHPPITGSRKHEHNRPAHLHRNLSREWESASGERVSASRSVPGCVGVCVARRPWGRVKTTAFEAECETLGEKAYLITARDFLTFEPQSHPEWRGKTLFIDGLDETRVGANDARTPFDQIRGRFDALGKPRFRLSCREADWLGANDQKHLESVSPDSKVTVLRLNPLTDSDIAVILEERSDIGDAQEFIILAQEQRVEGLLKNPQTLNMLADVVTQGSGWPKSRKETFEMACRQMIREHNEEHQAAQESNNPPTPDQLLDAAGRICAVQVISGAAGLTLRGQADEDYPAPDQCDSSNLEMLRPALATKLFKGVSNNRFIPVHRHIAEFLGARHFAQIIGTPASCSAHNRPDCGRGRLSSYGNERLVGLARGPLQGHPGGPHRTRSYRRRAIRRHPRVLHRRETCAFEMLEPRSVPT